MLSKDWCRGGGFILVASAPGPVGLIESIEAGPRVVPEAICKLSYKFSNSLMHKIVYAFDIDDTLDVSDGPIAVDLLRELRNRGYIIGLCGNWAVFVQAVPDWHEFISFIGPMSMTKEEFLTQIKSYIPCSRYVLVGNIKGVSGASDDEGAARKANWEFVKESEFI